MGGGKDHLATSFFRKILNLILNQNKHLCVIPKTKQRSLFQQCNFGENTVSQALFTNICEAQLNSTQKVSKFMDIPLKFTHGGLASVVTIHHQKISISFIFR